MSAETIATVGRGYELFANPRSIFSNEGAAAYSEIVQPDAELIVPPIYPDAERVYRGLEGWRRWWALIDEIWEEFGESGTPVSIPVAHVWTFHDERVMRIEVFLDRAQGLAATDLDADPGPL